MSIADRCTSALPARHGLRAFLPIGFTVALAISGVCSAQAQSTAASGDPRIPLLLESLDKVQSISQTAISPDGRHLAWVTGGKIILAGPKGENPEKIVAAGKNADCSSGGIAFSPDSQKLAFLSDCASAAGEVKPGEGKVTQDDLFILALGEKKAKQLSHLHGYVHESAWSPDGKSIGVLYVEGATRPAGALDAMKPPSGVIGVEGLEVQRVAAVDTATGQVNQITPAGLHVYEFDWSPDSAKLAYVAAPPPGENNWWVAKLYTQAVMLDGGSVSPSKLGGRAAFDPAALLDPATVEGPLHGLQIAVPRWSPDGSKIAFIGGLMSDQGATGGDVYVIASTGGAVDHLSQAYSAAWLSWRTDSHLIVSGIVNGASQISEWSLHFPASSEAPSTNGSRSYPLLNLTNPLITLPSSIGDGRLELSLSIAKGGTTAFVQTSFDHAPEVYTTKLEAGATPQQITHVNDTLQPSWGKAESVTWKNDGFDVQGWLLQPANYDPSKHYPMIVYVHGGPSSAVLPRWPGVGYGPVPFSSLGYFVLMPNPRGSYGEGEKFTQANRKDFGYGDFRDILAGVDAVEKKYPVDDKRLGLTGWSYGGFMTMFGVTQTNRFHAAVAGAGISDWQSYYGENSIDQWMTPFFGATVYDDPKVYAKSSAIDFIKNVRTPTLVVVGDRDGECPAPQSFEFWHALKAEHVPTELVVYPNEGHAFRLPEHRRDVLERALSWFQQYMQ
jgi:dipeptidyl aminopeptidase/acylaminoacyl peptidase